MSIYKCVPLAHRMGAMMEKIYTGAATLDKVLQFARANKQFYEYIGYDNYVSLASSIHPDDLEPFKKLVAELAVGESAELVVRIQAADGKYHNVLTKLTGITVADARQDSYVEIRIQDIEMLEDKLIDLHDENYLYSEFLDLCGEPLFLYDIKQNSFEIFNGGNINRVVSFRGTIESFEEQIVRQHAVADDYMQAFRELCQDIRNGAKGFEHRLIFRDKKRASGQDDCLIRGKTILNSRKDTVVLGCVRHGGADGGRGEYLQNDFERDVTTGLLAKKAIIEYTENLLRHKPKYNVNLCVVDIDNFKQVNDTLGHMFGDEVLATIANILKEAVAGKGLAGRIGGDEMFIVLEGINTLSDLRGILRSIRSNVEWAYKERKDVPRVTCSIGVSTYPDDALTYDDLFKIADKMLYRAKQKGKNRYIIYARDVHGDVLSENEPVSVQNSVSQRQEKEDLVLNMMEYMAQQTNRPFDMLLRDIGNTFGLDEVHLFYGDASKVLLESYWHVNGGEMPADSFANYVHEENFIHLYREHDMAVIDKLDLIEQLCPRMHKYLMTHGVKVALIYKMSCKKHEGYIAYCKMSDLSRKWSDSDMANLTYISKIIELLINDR